MTFLSSFLFGETLLYHMEITQKYYASARVEWRKWLEKHHSNEKEIWLVFYNKASGEPCISYSDAVEEALCFGWIDSTVKKPEPESDWRVQRFTPRRDKTNWSEPNKERVRFLIQQGKMTPAGLAVTNGLHEFKGKNKHEKKFTTKEIPKDILEKMRANALVWKHFQKFPDTYKRIRIGWIAATIIPTTRAQRLNYFLKMTEQNKKYGMMEKR